MLLTSTSWHIFWNGAIDEVLGRDITQEQPIGYKLPPTGTPPCVPPGNRWKQWNFKNPATGAITSPTKRPPPMVPKGGVTTNEPLAQRPPPPEVPKALAHLLAPREGIAFGDLDPLPQPTTPTTPIDVARREADAVPGTPQSPQTLSPTPIYDPDHVPEVPTITEETRRQNKTPPTPKAKNNPVRSPPENPKASAGSDDHSGDDTRPHSNNCPRRVK